MLRNFFGKHKNRCSSAPRNGVTYARCSRVESLEDRWMLDGAVGGESLQLFETSTALFVENQGQWEDENVRYEFDGPGVNIAFTDDGLSFLLTAHEKIEDQSERTDQLNLLPDGRLDASYDYITHSTQFSVSFDGANATIPIGLNAGDARFNYFVGDQENWRSDVRGYKTVAYEDVYDGIDLHTFGKRNSLKYEFYVAPGADYELIEISYDGIKGLWIDDGGQLHVETELGALVDDAPYIYQLVDGEQVEVAGRFQLIDTDTYTFQITGTYDSTIELVIDPNLDWGSYLGGNLGSSRSQETAIDAAGNVIVSGFTSAPGWVSGGWDTSISGTQDAFVVKFDSAGNHLWSSYVGGNGNEDSRSVTTDASGNIFLTGSTSSSGWVSGGWDTSLSGTSDGFVVKLSSSGTHVWSTYIGGSDYEQGRGIAVDQSSNVLIYGDTGSSGWVSGGGDTSLGGTSDAFVVKLSSSGSHVWSRYLGGSDIEKAGSLATDGTGNLYVTGFTRSYTGWIFAGWDTVYDGGTEDAFVVKISSSGGYIWGSYLGGGGRDHGIGITTDGSGNVLIAGDTISTGSSWVSGGWDTTYNGSNDGFVVKFDSSGNHLWSTYLGGSYGEEARDVVTDGSGNVFITGVTESNGWLSGGWESSLAGTSDAFVVRLNSSGNHMWSSYLGGNVDEVGSGIATDSIGNVLVTGETTSSGWLSGGWDTTQNSFFDGFVVKIDVFSFTVNTTGDTVDANLGDGLAKDASGNTSLRAAIQEGQSLSEPATIIVPASTYNLNLTGSGDNAGDLDITGEVTIIGAGPALSVIDATNLTNERIFDVFGTLNLSGVTLTGADITSGANGTSGGAIWVRSTGTLDVSQSALVDNVARNVGGAIYNDGAITVSDSVIASNSAVSYGGGIRNVGTATLSGTIVANNSGNSSGPNLMGSFSSDGSNLLSNITGATGFGNDHVGSVNYVVTEKKDENNTIVNVVDLSLREAIIAANDSGGTVWVPAWLHRLDVTGSGDNAGDLDVTDDVVIVGIGAGRTVIDANNLTNERIFDVFDTLGLSRVTLTGADITSGANGTSGGAIWVRSTGTLDLSESAIVDNTAGNVGGGIYNDGTIVVNDSVITNNSAVSYGGGIRDVGTATLSGTIVANNSGHSSGPNVMGSFSSDGTNMLTNITGATGFGSDYVAAVNYVVTGLADTFDHSDNSHVLSLREAVDLANTVAGAQTIWLPAWLLLLTRAGSETSAPNASIGDLDILQDLTILGVDESETTIDATAIADFVFSEIGTANLTTDRLTAIDG